MSTPIASPILACPRCGLDDRVGEVEVRRHLGAGEWVTHRMQVCGRCQWIMTGRPERTAE